MHFLFLSKVPVNEPPPGFPAAPLQRELLVYRNKEIFPFSQRPQERSVPPYFPKVGHLWKHMPISSALAYPLGSPVKELSLQVPIIELPWREMPHSQSSPSFIFQIPGIQASSRFPSRTPMGRDAHLQSLFYITFRVRSKGAPPSRFPSQSAHRERCSISRALQISLRIPSEWNP